MLPGLRSPFLRPTSEILTERFPQGPNPSDDILTVLYQWHELLFRVVVFLIMEDSIPISVAEMRPITISKLPLIE